MNITSDFNFLNTKKTWNKVKTNNKKCKYIDDISNKKEAAIEYIAKLNVPALPKKDNKEIVLGTTKYLLPYYILTDYFITFAFDINIYTEQLNTILIDCIGNGYFNSKMIRIITTPDDIVDNNNNNNNDNIKIMGKEIKYLMDNFSIKIYKLIDATNIYYITLKNTIITRTDIAEFTFEDNKTTVNKLKLQVCNTNTDNCNTYAIINNPVLMSDISMFDKNKLDKDIYAKDFYNIDNRLTIYNGVKLLFNQKKYNKIFGPNIDTILFCSTIDKFLKKQKFKSFLEIGIGSGYISKYIAVKDNNMKGTLIDIEPQSINFAKNKLGLPNTLPNKWHNIKDKNFDIYKQNNYELIKGDALKLIYLMINNLWNNIYDLVICNPPYIPKQIEKKEIDPNDKEIAKNFFEGTYLMRYILKNLHYITSKSMIMILSSTSFQVPHVKDELNNLIKKGWYIKILLKRKIPLKVYNDKGEYIHDDKKWTEFLLNNKTIVIGTEKFKQGAILYNSKPLPLYHIIYIVEISKKI